MNGFSIYTFLFSMWILILVGGSIAVIVLGPISITGYDQYDMILSSGIKAIIAILLVVTWIFILSKIKDWIFRKQLKA